MCARRCALILLTHLLLTGREWPISIDMIVELHTRQRQFLRRMAFSPQRCEGQVEGAATKANPNAYSTTQSCEHTFFNIVVSRQEGEGSLCLSGGRMLLGLTQIGEYRGSFSKKVCKRLSQTDLTMVQHHPNTSWPNLRQQSLQQSVMLLTRQRGFRIEPVIISAVGFASTGSGSSGMT